MKSTELSVPAQLVQFAFYFANGTVGYMGLQKDINQDKKAIFSIWDNNATPRATPARDVCKRFDHEGNMKDLGALCVMKRSAGCT